MYSKDIEKLIKIISKLPGLGQRSAKRQALFLMKKKEAVLIPMIEIMQNVADNIKACKICGNFDTDEICNICRDEKKDSSLLCVVQDVADLWAMERSSHFKGRYHVIGGLLSALDGIGPDNLNIKTLFERIKKESIKEIIMALPLTVDGQTTSHFMVNKLKDYDVKITTLAHGVPMGGELDYLDDGTIETALRHRLDM